MCPGSPLTCSVFKKRKRSKRRQGKNSELRILAVLLGVTSFTRRDDLRPMTEQRFRRHLRLPTQAPRALSTWCEAGEPSCTQVSIDSHGHLTSRQRPGQSVPKTRSRVLHRMWRGILSNTEERENNVIWCLLCCCLAGF